jgi:hypothetical protein
VFTTLGLGIFLMVYAIWNLVLYLRIRNLKRQIRDHKPLELRCQCGHLFTSHRPGHCREAIRREHYDRDGDRSGWQWRDCTCSGYLGPDPEMLGLWRPVEEKEKGSLTRYGAQVDPYLD